MKTLKEIITEANKVTNKQRTDSINKFASAAHEDWRKGYQAEKGNIPR